MSWSLTVLCELDRADIVAAEFWERGATGIVEEEEPGKGVRLRAFFDRWTEELEEFGGEWREEPERDWVREWSETWKAVELGERLFLVPDFIDVPTPPGRVRVETHPGRAYGTGMSEATQLALLGVERHLRNGDTVLDVGTGTGILSVAAVRLGAGRVIACDIDPEAVEVADANIHRDEVSVNLFVGSVRAIAGGSVELLVANINATTIGMLAGDIRRVLRKGGKAVTSGFLHRDAAGVRRAMARLREVEVREQGEWVSLVFVRE